MIAFAGGGGTSVYDLQTDSLLFKDSGYLFVKFTSDGNFLITNNGSTFNYAGISIYDTKSWLKINSINLSLDALDISYDSKFMALGVSSWNRLKLDSSGIISIFSFPNITWLKTLLVKKSLHVYHVSFSSDGQYLAAATSDGVKIWNTSDWSLFTDITIGSDSRAVTFSADNKYVVAGFTIGGKDWARLYLYNLAINKIINSYLLGYLRDGQEGGDVPTCVSISNDSKYIAVGSMGAIFMLNAKWNPTSVSDNSEQKNNKIISPNPATGEISLNFEIENTTSTIINLTDINGDKIRNLFNDCLPVGQNSLKFDISDLSCGTYFIQIKNGEYEYSDKFVVVK
ncbi:MAG: T9SS type A sorting domain-containing protein [Candidatus Kapabacteria bacterium]|nr:T9SS type A sorting domain-containing protein [Candidatus Kapabacteria bacterium]